ncbi:MAG: DUF2065 family protein [Gammaproteobacteria bacterium]
MLLILSFFLILEGLFPFLAPELFRKFLKTISDCSNNSLRILGLVCIILGLILFIIFYITYL